MITHPAGQRRQYITDRLSGKKSKNEVNYRPAEHETTENCAECVHYTVPGQPAANCKLVAGVIQGGMMCDLFKRTDGSNASTDTGVEININIGKV